MAKLVLVLVVYFVSSVLIYCSDASRPLPALAASSTDPKALTTDTAKSNFFSSASASPAAESGSDTDEEALEAFGPPCTEEDLDDSSVEGGRPPCHRVLVDGTNFAMLDYGGLGHSNPNPKP